MTPAQAKRQRADLMRAIARELKAKNRAKLIELREFVRRMTRQRREAMALAIARCRAGRKLPTRAQIVAELAAAKRAARRSCDVDIKAARAMKDDVKRSRAELAAEQSYQREIRRIEAGNRKKTKDAHRPGLARARAGESDDEVRGNIPPELVALWDRVKRSIKGSDRLSRTEAFLHYAHEHPDEEWSALEDSVDRAIAEMERRQAMPNPKKKKRAKKKNAPTLTAKQSKRRFAQLKKAGCKPKRVRLPTGESVVVRRRACAAPPLRNPKKKKKKAKAGPDELARTLAASRSWKGGKGDRARMSADYWRIPRAARAANLHKLRRGTPRQRRAAVAIARAERVRAEGPPRKHNGRMTDAGALAEYERTHWGERGRASVRRAGAPDPRHGTATKLGELVSVVYLTKKGGDRELTEYEHAFEKRRPELVYNDGGLMIAGGDYVIAEGGIDG